MRSQSADRRQDRPAKLEFLVSFLVDARGGAMTGSRRSGIRIVIPPQCAEQPVRITCRQLRPENVLHLPPLSEGEGLACRVLQLTPATFLAPVLLEVPHYTPLGEDREVVVLRSDNGKKWSGHTNSSSTAHLTAFLNTSISSLASPPATQDNNNPASESEEGSPVTSIISSTLPQFFAIVNRPRQEGRAIGPEGGLVTSALVPQVQCFFPSRSLTKEVTVGISVCPVAPALAESVLAQGSCSPLVTVEPRRRKFHRPITVTLPLPAGPAEDTMLACSMSGAGARAVWEDVTHSTPLTYIHDCVQFTTVVSAQFWLLHLPMAPHHDRLHTTENFYRAVTRVPYMARVWLYWRQQGTEEEGEAEVRVVVSTEGERVVEAPLEEREGFLPLSRSQEVVVGEKVELEVTLQGNLTVVGEERARLQFRPFSENRVTLVVVRRDAAISAAGGLTLAGEGGAIHSTPLFLPLAKA